MTALSDENHMKTELHKKGPGYSKHGELAPYLLSDYWTVHDIPYLLSNIDPTRTDLQGTYSTRPHVTLLNGFKLQGRDREEDHSLAEVKLQYQRIKRLWAGSNHDLATRDIVNNLTAYDVNYCLEWASRKRIEIPWLPWATEADLLPRKTSELTDTRANLRVAAHPAKLSEDLTSYPYLLHLCLNIWEDLYHKNPPPRPKDHKKAIEDWLKINKVTWLSETELRYVASFIAPVPVKRLDGNRGKSWCAPTVPDPA